MHGDGVRMIRLSALVWVMCASPILSPEPLAVVLFGQVGAASMLALILPPAAALLLAAWGLACRRRTA